jgi:hypothetical protein
MPVPELSDFGEDLATASLLAIVCVEYADRVRCGQPNCGHSVYRRIHVVKEGGKLLVLGSTCYAKRYGNDSALGTTHFGGGDGRMLTAEERQLLLNNTQALIAQFEKEAALLRGAKVKPAPAVLQPSRNEITPQSTIVTYHQETPWAWVKPLTSVIYLKLKDGSGWIRAQRKDDKHLLVPWPVFDGWDEALPPLFGPVDIECGGHVLPDVVAALKYLRNHSEWETKPGRWKDVMAEISGRTRETEQTKWR